MVNDHKSIEFLGKPLFTWLDFNTPMEESLPIPSEACFTYIIEGDSHSISKNEGISAKTGEVILSLCGLTLSHMLTDQEQGRINSIIIHFHPDQLKEIYKDSKPPFWSEIDAPVTQYIVQMAASNLIKQYIEGVINLFENREAVTEEILILKLKEIILLLLQTKDSIQINQMVKSLFSERTFSFKEIVEAHIYLPITLEDLAGLTNTSLSTFKREFKKIYQSTPAAYIIDQRAEKVAQLLKLSDEPISSIGYQCGFSTPAHLSRVFKSKYGLTPSEYRLNLSDK